MPSPFPGMDLELDYGQEPEVAIAGQERMGARQLLDEKQRD